MLSGVASHSLQVKLFRREAVAASRFRALGRLPVATSPGIFVAASCALFAGLLVVAAAVLIEVPERVRVEGVLMPEGKVLAVRATRAGVVSELRVGDGDWVHRGQRLLGIGEQQHAFDDLSMNASQQKSLRRELDLLESDFDEEHRRAVARHTLAEEQRRLVSARLDAVIAELESRTRLLDVRTRRLERAGELLQRDAIASQQFDELRESVLQAQASRQAAAQAVIGLRSELLAAERELVLLAAEPRRVETRWAARREVLLRQLAVLAAAASAPLTAPDGGVVAALLVRNGSAVLPGQLLLNIADPEKPLEAFIYLGPDVAGRVSVGQQVEMRLHAYPYQRFGTLTATVSSVAGVPVPAASAGVAAVGTGYVY